MGSATGQHRRIFGWRQEIVAGDVTIHDGEAHKRGGGGPCQPGGTGWMRAMRGVPGKESREHRLRPALLLSFITRCSMPRFGLGLNAYTEKHGKWICRQSPDRATIGAASETVQLSGQPVRQCNYWGSQWGMPPQLPLTRSVFCSTQHLQLPLGLLSGHWSPACSHDLAAMHTTACIGVSAAAAGRTRIT